jgi:hypothetical protein
MSVRGARESSNTMSAPRCTQHPDRGSIDRPHGECVHCRRERQRRYGKRRTDAYRKMRQLEALLAIA